MFSCKPSEAINNIVCNGFATVYSNKRCQSKTLQRVLSIDTWHIFGTILTGAEKLSFVWQRSNTSCTGN